MKAESEPHAATQDARNGQRKGRYCVELWEYMTILEVRSYRIMINNEERIKNDGFINPHSTPWPHNLNDGPVIKWKQPSHA